MKRRLRLVGLTLSCLTVATVALAQQCPKVNSCGLTDASADTVLHAPMTKVEKARLTRPIETRGVRDAVIVQVAIAPPR
ncbi:hypothetical protein [Bosea sp. PAMC 26642]|uniref:hypothetical protein n=1 Tax=Bosea sp. (strain PAMC 26642) TaxID=1792307 RepID=UPI0007702880|nr:hypothetical protein [Bosea sp. PAMC 26642]AMJ60139.1 hypothetical protein AXW83_07350 [Bosea sp. PAMC 26642]